MEELREKALYWESVFLSGFGFLIFSALILVAIDKSNLATLSLCLSLISLIAYCIVGILESCFLEEKSLPIYRLIRVTFLLCVLLVTGYIFVDLFGGKFIDLLNNFETNQIYLSLKKYLTL
ncbi:MAG: hypothetical protein E7005_00425 [Alphaproteobacteria bacterium]|nr:hypothetical protein [Alphaproteobacteria bacterium]